MHRMVTTFGLALLLLTSAITSAQNVQDQHSHVIWIGVAHESEAETRMATELRDLIRTHDVDPWVLTRKILIDEEQIPHSHPILTIHTRHIGNEIGLLSTFIHEQLHWLEAEPWLENFRAAMEDFEKFYPLVPSSAEGGARDNQSTYRHLLVCDMELQVLTTLLGEAASRETLTLNTHYQWIYEKVLSDPRIREVALRHGFNVSGGIPSQSVGSITPM